MDTIETPTARRRVVTAGLIGLIALGALAWVAGLAAVGFISSRPDPIIGEWTQSFVFTYVLLLPAFLVVGARVRYVRRRRSATTAPAVGAVPGRRRFVVDGVAFAGATVVGASVARPVVFAAADPRAPTRMITDEHGAPGGRRVLVAYESQYGSTAEIADRIGQTLGERGGHVDVRHVADVDSIAGYDLVVVGGAIQYDQWMPGAVDFVRRHRRQLAATRCALFFTCLALSKPGDGARRSADQYERKIRAIAPEIEPLSVGGFAGVLDYARMSPVTRVFARVLLTLQGAEAGDHRDWSGIRSWAGDLTSAGSGADAIDRRGG